MDKEEKLVLACMCVLLGGVAGSLILSFALNEFIGAWGFGLVYGIISLVAVVFGGNHLWRLYNE